MKILIVTPAPPGSRTGNRTTALRWAQHLKSLGHRVGLATEWTDTACDLLVALHAWRSLPSIRRFKCAHPDRPVILGLGGTDLYRDLARHPSSGDSLVLADGIVVLQPEALRKLPPAARKKARVIFQSEPFRRRKARVNRRSFDVCVLSNLRGLKDPLRAALASRYVPAASRIRILHAGEAVDPALARRARAEMVRNHRYRWFGSLPRSAALRLLEKSDLLVVSSEMEGGANVVSEALARSVPVVASRIPGNLGMLGRDYAGYYKLRDTKQLARLLLRAESDPDFLNRLAASCRRRRELIRPARERKAWRELISELVKPRRRSRRVSRK